MSKEKIELAYQKRKRDLLNRQEKALEETRYLIEFRNQVTNRVSLICRIISIGILAAVFSLVKSPEKAPHVVFVFNSYLVIATSFSCSAALFFDYFHYVFSNRTVNNAFSDKELRFNSRSKSYIVANCFFNLKQLFTLLGAIFYCIFAFVYFKEMPKSKSIVQNSQQEVLKAK